AAPRVRAEVAALGVQHVHADRRGEERDEGLARVEVRPAAELDVVVGEAAKAAAVSEGLLENDVGILPDIANLHRRVRARGKAEDGAPAERGFLVNGPGRNRRERI